MNVIPGLEVTHEASLFIERQRWPKLPDGIAQFIECGVPGFPLGPAVGQPVTKRDQPLTQRAPRSQVGSGPQEFGRRCEYTIEEQARGHFFRRYGA